MKSKYLFYFCDGVGSVFDSQVLALLNAISEKKIFEKILLFLSIKNEKQREEIRERKINAEIEIVTFKSYPNYPFFNFLIRKNLQKVIGNTNINLEEVIFHTRGEMIAWHLKRVLDNKYLRNIFPDIRGASVEEITEFYDLNKILKSLKIYSNKKAAKNLKNFKKIYAVSESLKKYLTNNYDINSEKVAVIPSLASNNFRFDEQKRRKLRYELNLNSKDLMVVFSSGGTANWQNNDIIKILADKGLKVLNLSKKAIRHKNIINKFITYFEMPMYLNSADAAIIWRDKSIVNSVASPVKFSEYICCGLPVIANRSVDMISELITHEKCGVLLDDIEEVNLNILDDLRQKDRTKISELGISKFGIDIIANKYIQSYLSMENL